MTSLRPSNLTIDDGVSSIQPRNDDVMSSVQDLRGLIGDRRPNNGEKDDEEEKDM